jgi:predicted ATPase/class 3 adenylate cyclase
MEGIKMKCPKCQFENPEGVNFCVECGGKLEIICPKCGYSNSISYKFCGGCGHKLGIPVEIPPKDLSFDEKLTKIQKYLPKGLTEKILSQRDRIEGEHKQVTVMFCDLAEYSPISEQLGAEETYQLMDEIYELLIHEVHRYEGTVNELTGDGILALFGAPIALEDAPLRSIRSALAIQREMAHAADEKDISLRMRIGIHTGMVVVGTLGNDLRVDFKAVGDTVNIAARLEQLAEPRSILISESTYRLVEGFFRFEALGDRMVKGKSEPLAVYRVLGAGRSRSRFEARAEGGLTRFAGRERELEILWDCFERVKKEKGQALSIVSEAGMGKSRLLYEFRKSLANEDVTFLEGCCVSYGQNTPYLPVVDVLKDNFRVETDDSPKVISKKVKHGWEQIEPKPDQSNDATIPYLLELFAVENGFEALKNMDPEIKRRKTFEVLKNLSLRGAQVRPLVIAFEDLHWIDKTSEESIKLLMEHIPGARVFLIFTFRSNYLPPWGGKTYYSQITLNRLSNRESLDMIRSFLNAGEIAEDLAGLILEKTEGVPFFIEEFTRVLRESGSVIKTNECHHLASDSAEFSIPETLHDLLMSRVDRLHEGAKEILQIGSVIEREFSWTLLKEVTDFAEMDLLSRLSHLKEAELIFEKGIFPQVNYIFQNAMTRELVYNSLMAIKRKEYHLAIGKTMEHIYADRLEEHSPMLALHHTRGGDYERGYVYHHMAGNLAARSYANQEALEHLSEAWNLIDEMDLEPGVYEKRLDTVIKLAEVMETLGQFEPTITLIREALKSSEGMENCPSYAGVHYWMGHTHGNLGQYDEARKYLDRSLELSQQSGNIEIEGLAHDYLGQLDFFQGFLKSAIEHMKAAIRCLREIGNQTRLPWSVAFKALIFCQLKHADRWEDVLQEAKTLIDRSGNERAMCALSLSKSIHLLRTGQYEEAMSFALEGLERAEKIGEMIQIPFFLGYAAKGALLAGKNKQAIALVHQGQAESEKVGHPLGKSLIQITKAEILLRSGRVEESIFPIQEALAVCRQLDLGGFLQQALHINAEILANQIPTDEKKIDEMMQEATALVQRSNSRWYRIDHLLTEARINLKIRKPELSRKCISEAKSLYRELGLKNATEELLLVEEELENQKIDNR